MMTRYPVYVATLGFYTECTAVIRVFAKEADAKAFEDCFDNHMRRFNGATMNMLGYTADWYAKHAEIFKSFIDAYPWVLEIDTGYDLALYEWQDIDIETVIYQP